MRQLLQSQRLRNPQRIRLLIRQRLILQARRQLIRQRVILQVRRLLIRLRVILQMRRLLIRLRVIPQVSRLLIRQPRRQRKRARMINHAPSCALY